MYRCHYWVIIVFIVFLKGDQDSLKWYLAEHKRALVTQPTCTHSNNCHSEQLRSVGVQSNTEVTA